MLLDNTVNSSCNILNKNVIAFDFDGTIVDCKIRQVEVLRSILRMKSIDIKYLSLDEWWNYKINGDNTINALLKLRVKAHLAKIINAYWIEIIENPEWLDLDNLKNGISILLNWLYNNNFLTYVITARRSNYFFLNQIEKLSVSQFFSSCFVVNPTGSVKNKYEILNILRPSLYIGDTENDYYSARKANINFLAISTGQRSKQFLSNLGVENIIDNLSHFTINSNDQIFRS